MNIILALLRKWIKEADPVTTREAFVNLNDSWLRVRLSLTELGSMGVRGKTFSMEVAFDWREIEFGIDWESVVQFSLEDMAHELNKAMTTT